MIDIKVLTSKHRPSITANMLVNVPHEVYINKDWDLPEDYRNKPYHSLSVYGKGDNSLGLYRCTKGHQEICKSITNNTLILEDDASVTFAHIADWLMIVEMCASLLKYYEVVSLHTRGATYSNPFKYHELSFDRPSRSNTSYPKLRWGVGGLAYLITPKAAQRFSCEPWDGTPSDVMLLNKFDTVCLIDTNDPLFIHDRSHMSLVENAT